MTTVLNTTVRWRKSSRSGPEANCVELGWRKSTYSAGNETCVELAQTGLVRDSKNPSGPTLRADLGGLLAAVKTGRLDS